MYEHACIHDILKVSKIPLYQFGSMVNLQSGNRSHPLFINNFRLHEFILCNISKKIGSIYNVMLVYHNCHKDYGLGRLSLSLCIIDQDGFHVHVLMLFSLLHAMTKFIEARIKIYLSSSNKYWIDLCLSIDKDP